MSTTQTTGKSATLNGGVGLQPRAMQPCPFCGQPPDVTQYNGSAIARCVNKDCALRPEVEREGEVHYWNEARDSWYHDGKQAEAEVRRLWNERAT